MRHGSATGSSAMPNGVSVADLCRKHGVSDATVYKWKARFGGMDVSEAIRLKALEAVAHLMAGHGMSERRACLVLGCCRMTARYQTVRVDDVDR